MTEKKPARNGYQGIREVIKSISGQARILTIPRIFIDVMQGDIKAALLLSQMIYWGDRSNSPDGEFYKSYQDWESELSLSRYEVTRIAKLLKDMNLLTITNRRTKTSFPVLHYAVNLDLLIDYIARLYNLDMQETHTSDMRETHISGPLTINSNIHRLHPYKDDEEKTRRALLSSMGILGGQVLEEVIKYLATWTTSQFEDITAKATKQATKGNPGGLLIYWVRQGVKPCKDKTPLPDYTDHGGDCMDPETDQEIKTIEDQSGDNALRAQITKYLGMLLNNVTDDRNKIAEGAKVGNITNQEIELIISPWVGEYFKSPPLQDQLARLIDPGNHRIYRVSVLAENRFRVHSSQNKIINQEDLING